ncbi:MAG: P1 family peptidase [Hyphomicrobium sp.]
MTQRRNAITDVPGLKVGNADDALAMTGVTVVMADEPMTAAVDVRGGGPGTRDTDALGLAGTVDQLHALVLSGGSAFGLSAATGVQTWLAERGIGFPVGKVRVPIVPQAILFDLANGGDKQWGTSPPYERLARTACAAAATEFAIGSAGAGHGATVANLRGGLGTASDHLDGGLVVGALVAVNAVGSATIGGTPHFWAAPFERDGEFGERGLPSPWPANALDLCLKGGPMQSTTIAIVATNARLSKPQCHRLAVMAQTGLARALYPVHTPLDGDVVFAVATGAVPIEPVAGLARLGAVAANVLARAVARGVHAAAPAPSGWTGPPAWVSLHGGAGT